MKTNIYDIFFGHTYCHMTCLIENEYIRDCFLTYILPNDLPNWKWIYTWFFSWPTYCWMNCLSENEYRSFSLTYSLPNDLPHWKRIYIRFFFPDLYIAEWMAELKTNIYVIFSWPIYCWMNCLIDNEYITNYLRDRQS